MSEELRRCPMCGDPLEIVHRNGSKYVRCITCIFETARHRNHVSDDELKRRCNRRPAEDALKAENERLKCIANDLYNLALLMQKSFEATMESVKNKIGKDFYSDLILKTVKILFNSREESIKGICEDCNDDCCKCDMSKVLGKMIATDTKWRIKEKGKENE